MKVLRKIIQIDEELCDGCGQCVPDCAEGSLQIIDGKARLVADKLCDGLGACLGACPTGALKIIEREADEFDEEAVEHFLAGKAQAAPAPPATGGCPSARLQNFAPMSPCQAANAPATQSGSALTHWPVQIRLIPPTAPFLENCDLLVAADCTAFAYANIHNDFMKNRVTLIGCPKLDRADYAEKLTAILTENDVRSVTLTRMEVPCCGGLEHAAWEALRASGKFLPWQVVTISIDGKILDR